eukprot:TRINITY_DN13397_c0_g1_i1.p1 TRINITY_DN13397_c0_g1~~TRINITY_DN13397_c0_g1_i1.p1  ORF type:complete len:654 (+),score=170.15 TRINITY_DN13397_c0_g1_i1:26-1987(+)
MESFTSNGVQIYDMTVGKTLPEWLSSNQKKALKKNLGFRNRLELIQDFHFPVACGSLEYSPDGKFMIASGLYPPQVKIFELGELSMKVSRNVDCEIVTTKILSDDYSKVAILRTDRVIEFHAKYGQHYKIRVPKHARDMVYDFSNCDLMTVGDGSEIYRLNLERGTFLKPLASSCSGINAGDINAHNGIYGFAGEDGIAEFWDPRSRKPVAFLDVSSEVRKLTRGINLDVTQLTSIKFNGHLNVAVGTSTGQVLLYDMRKNDSLQLKDHHYGLPVHKIIFHEYNNTVVSACKKIIKVWNPDTSKTFTSIETPMPINDVCIRDQDGLLFACTESPKICTYYIPDMGPAPEWASWVDNLTQEADKKKEDETIYQDYHFITESELNNLGVTNLKGTPYLRAYLHGYFMDIRLYKKIRALVDPNSYEVLMKEKIEKRMQKRREGRIKLNTKMPSVNKEYLLRLSQANEKEKTKITDVLYDERFKDMFEQDDFKIDVDNHNWHIRHASDKFRKMKDIDAEFDRIDFASDEEEESSEVPDDIDEQTNDLLKELAEVKARKKDKIKFYEVKDHMNPLEKKDKPKIKNKEKKTFAERAEMEANSNSIDRVFGSVSMSFVPSEQKKVVEDRKKALKVRKLRDTNRRSMSKFIDPKPKKKRRT